MSASKILRDIISSEAALQSLMRPLHRRVARGPTRQEEAMHKDLFHHKLRLPHEETSQSKLTK